MSKRTTLEHLRASLDASVIEERRLQKLYQDEFSRRERLRIGVCQEMEALVRDRRIPICVRSEISKRMHAVVPVGESLRCAVSCAF